MAQSSSLGQGPVQDAAALGLFLGLGFKRYQIPAEVWLSTEKCQGSSVSVV